MASKASDSWTWLPDNGSETSRLVREVDWSSTSLGPVEGWSPALKQVVAMVIHASYPMFLWWGPDLIQVYNDGYIPSFGRGRHPQAMGQRGRECWAEIWPIIGPQIESVLSSGRPVQFEDALVPITRNERLEDVFWTYTYTPVFEVDGSVAGVLVIVNESTRRVLSERRRVLVRDVVATLASLEVDDEMFEAFARLLAGSDFVWMIARQSDARGRASQRYASPHAPSSPTPEDRAITVPLEQDSGERRGELVLGVDPRRPVDSLLQEHAVLLGRMFGNALARLDAVAARESAQRERTNLLLQAPVAAALMVGPTLRFELANRGYVAMVGREVVGRTWREAFPELIGTQIEQLVIGAFERGEPFRAHEQLVPLSSEGDDDRYFDFNLIPIRDGDRVESVLVVAVELTQQVRARRALEQAGLDREVLLLDLEAASQAKDEFLAMLGHELRNPLAPIVTALELLGAGGAVADRARAVIARQSAHLVRLVDDLLDIARLTRGLIELRKEPNDVTTMVRNGVEIASELISQRRHQLSVDVENKLTWNGDATRMTQVIANLLTNAARYTDPGGEIRISAREANGALVISVSDTGKGIEDSLRQRIFDPFIQGPRTLDRRDGGLGLGLALAKNLITLHGGTIEARSAGVGKGSEFVVSVPGLVTSEPAAEPRRSDASHPQTPRRILVVDDNEDAAQLLGDVLKMSGHETAIAMDGASAIALFDVFRPDTAILDIGLPGMDGYALLAALRSREGAARCRFFALTGFAQASDVKRALEAGFAGHLSKPVSLARLRALLAEER